MQRRDVIERLLEEQKMERKHQLDFIRGLQTISGCLKSSFPRASGVYLKTFWGSFACPALKLLASPACAVGLGLHFHPGQCHVFQSMS